MVQVIALQSQKGSKIQVHIELFPNLTPAKTDTTAWPSLPIWWTALGKQMMKRLGNIAWLPSKNCLFVCYGAFSITFWCVFDSVVFWWDVWYIKDDPERSPYGFPWFSQQEGVVLAPFFVVYKENSFQKSVKTRFCNHIDSNRSQIDFLDATLAQISQGSRISHADPPAKPQSLAPKSKCTFDFDIWIIPKPASRQNWHNRLTLAPHLDGAPSGRREMQSSPRVLGLWNGGGVGGQNKSRFHKMSFGEWDRNPIL